MYLKRIALGFLSVLIVMSCFPERIRTQEQFTHPFLPITAKYYQPQTLPTETKIIQETFSTTDFHFSKEKNGFAFRLKQCDVITQEGSPQLPRFDRIIPLQKNQVITSVETVSLVTKELVLPNIPIQLVPPLRPYNGKPLPTEDLQTSTDSFQITQFPKENFDIQFCFTDDTRMVRLSIYPVYIRSDRWYLTESIQLKISLASEEKEELPDIRKKDSIILVPDEFSDEANQLKKMQEKQGYTVSVLKLSSVASLPMADRPKSTGYKGFADYKGEGIEAVKDYDDITARKIITWLQQKLTKDEADYLTILGDSKIIPPSYYIYYGGGEQEFENWIPTDQFYACPFNLDEDFTFYLRVGRIPARTKDELQGYLQKLNAYMTQLKPDWFSQTAVMGGDPFDGEYMGELLTSSTINQDRLNGFEIEKYFRTEDKFDLQSFEDLLKNKDKGIIYEIGHGGGSELYLEPGVADTNFCYSLPKKEKLPIMLSIACMNGAWDTRQFPDTFRTPRSVQFPTSFSQAMIFSPGGSIAYVGGARNNYGYIDFEWENGLIELSDEANYMAFILSHFCKNMQENAGSLGEIAKKTLETYIDEGSGYRYISGVDTFFGFILMGDPTLILPTIEPVKKYTAPVLSTKEEWKLNTDKLPLCPIDNGFKMTIASTSPTLQFKIAELGTELSALKEAGSLKNQSQKSIDSTFQPTTKGFLTLRIETEDSKENRFMFWSKYYHDLVISSRPSLSFLRAGESQKMQFTLINDGIEDETNVKATISLGDQIKTYDFPSFPSFSQSFLWLDVDYQTVEKTDIVVKAEALNGEKSIDDNQFQLLVQSPRDLFYRVGYWSYSYFLDGTRSPSKITEKLNQVLQDAGYPVEFFPMQLLQDSNDSSFMSERFKPDCVILDSPDAFDYDFTTSFRNLRDYMNNGGKIISLGSVGKNSYDIPIDVIHPLLNITSDTLLKEKEITDEKITLEMNQDLQTYFSKPSYQLPCNRVILPENDASFATMFDNPSVLGSSETTGVYFVDSGLVTVLNGYFDWTKLEEMSDLPVFLFDLIRYASEKSVLPVIKNIKINPAIGSKNKNANGTAYLEYYGRTETKPMQLVIQGETAWKQTIPIDSLKPYEKRAIAFSLDLSKMSGTKSIELLLVEDGKEITKFTQPYTVLSHNEPDAPPELSLKNNPTASTVTMQYTIEGKTNPDASLLINQQSVGVNQDGQFAVIYPLKEGSNQFEVIASQGSLSTKTNLQVERLKPIRISLPIGKKYCLVNEKETILDEPALIVNGSTFVPIRFLAESFQIKVDWNAKEQKITLSQNRLTIELWIGKKTAMINGQEYKLSNPPFIRNGRTLLPVRFIAEGLQASVSWNKDNQEVFIQIGIPYPKSEASMQTTSLIDTENESPRVLDQPIPEKYVFPLCIDQYQDTLYGITNQDIVTYNENFEILTKTPIPEEFWSCGSIENKQTILTVANRALMRVNEKYLVLTDALTNIYIYNRETLKLMDTVKNMEYGLCFSDGSNFRQIFDMEISDENLLYIGGLYGIVVYDIVNKTILRSFDIFYAIDIVLASDKMYVSSLTDIDIYSLMGAHIKTIETEESYIFSYSMTQFDKETLLVTDPLGMALRKIKDDGTITKKVSMSSKYGYFQEKILKKDDTFLMLSFVLSKKIPFYQSKILVLDSNLKVKKESHKDFSKALKDLSWHLPGPTNIYLTSDNTKYINLNNPIEAFNFIKIEPDAEEYEEISIEISYENATYYDSLMDQYFYPDNQLGLLIVNGMTAGSTLFVYDFEEEDSFSFPLVTTKEYSLITSFAFDEEKVVGYDQIYSEFVLFDIETGEETERIPVIPDINPYAVSDMILRNDTIFFLDKPSSSIYSFQLSDKKRSVMNFQYFLPNNGNGLTCFDIDSEGTIYVLDHLSGSITTIQNGEVKQCGNSRKLSNNDEFSSHYLDFYHPDLLSVNTKQMVIYDFGNQRIVELPVNIEQEVESKKTEIHVYPESIHQDFFREQEILIPLSIQVVNKKGSITISDLPDGVVFDTFQDSVESQIVTLKIIPSKIAGAIEKTITISCNEIELAIPIRLTPLTPFLIGTQDSPYFHYPNGYFLSKSPLSIQKGIVFAGEDFLRFYGIDVLVTGKEIQISRDGIVFLLETNSENAYLYMNKTKIPFKLDLPLKKDANQWLIPLNSILDMFGRPITVQQNNITFSY